MSDGFVATQSELLHVSSDHELTQADLRRLVDVHLLVEPVGEARDVSSTSRDGGITLGTDFIVEGRGAAKCGLTHESPNFSLQRISCGSLPSRPPEHGRDEVGLVRIKVN